MEPTLQSPPACGFAAPPGLAIPVRSGALSSREQIGDTELMLLVKQGCNDSFRRLVRRHQEGLFHYLFRRVQNAAIAEELAQEVFLRVYLARERYQPSARFTTWLYRIALNCALNWVRDHRRERMMLAVDSPAARPYARHEPAQECGILRDERMNQVREALTELTERQRAAVVMHKYQGLEYAQIAELLGCSIAAVKSLLFRTYANLREILDPAPAVAHRC